MRQFCDKCNRSFNDDYHSTLCPHKGIGFCAVCDCAICVCTEQMAGDWERSAANRQRSGRVMPQSTLAASDSPIRHFDGNYRFLSNFYLLPMEYLEYQGVDFYSVEHAYQGAKASDREVFRTFGVGFCAQCHNHSEDHRLSMCPIEWATMTGDPCKWSSTAKFKRMTPGDAKRLGRKIPIRPDWEKVKLDVMLELLRLKFKQPELRPMLLSTGYSELVEGNSWHDLYWGVDERNGRGQNHLGKLLMQVREELRSERP